MANKSYKQSRENGTETGAEVHKIAINNVILKRTGRYFSDKHTVFRRGVLSGWINELMDEKLQEEGY